MAYTKSMRITTEGVACAEAIQVRVREQGVAAMPPRVRQSLARQPNPTALGAIVSAALWDLLERIDPDEAARIEKQFKDQSE